MLPLLVTASLTAIAAPATGADALDSANHQQWTGYVQPAPLVESVARKADSRTVEITTSDRLVLRAELYLPDDEGRRAPAAMIVHDAGQSRAQVEKLAERMQRQGFAVLVPDLRGHGESANEECSWESCDESGRESIWRFAMRDLEAAATWLRQSDRVHATNLSMVGVGAGSVLAARQAVNDENVRSLGLIVPRESQFGYDLINDLVELEGLPIHVFAPKDQRDEAESLRDAAQEQCGGREFLELSVLKSRAEDVLDDRKLPTDLARWLGEHAFPRRGTGRE